MIIHSRCFFLAISWTYRLHRLKSLFACLCQNKTIQYICDNCNRKEDKNHEILYSEPHGNFTSDCLGEASGRCAPLGFAQTVLGKIAMGLLGKIFHEFFPLSCCTVLYVLVLYCTVLYCTVLYCTVLYCTVLYCTVLYSEVIFTKWK